jgi:hypothetical protein
MQILWGRKSSLPIFCKCCEPCESGVKHHNLYFIPYNIKHLSVSSTNKTDHHDIIEILLEVVLNTITLTLI